MKREKLEKLLDRFNDLYSDNNKRLNDLRDTLWLLDSLDEDENEFYESQIDKSAQNGDVFGLKSLCRNMLVALRTILCEAMVAREMIESDLKQELLRLVDVKSEAGTRLYNDVLNYMAGINEEDEGDGTEG